MDADLAVVGLGVMGANLARNFRSRGFTVAVHNRNTGVLDRFMAEHGGPGPGAFVRCPDGRSLAAALKRPRIIVMMVTAGQAVDAVIGSVGEFLEPGDILVDGGNSHFADTERRSVAAGA